jgi:hypothetical protein
MKRNRLRCLLPFVCLFACVLLSGCAAQKSVIVLLPEDGRIPSEVTVVNAQGTQLLNRPWQSVEIAGPHGRPESPIVLDKTAVEGDFGAVLAGLPLPPAHYVVFFKLNSAEILPDSQPLLPVIAKDINDRHPAQLSVVGHTDTVDSAEYNYRLGLLRARAVIKLLASYGAAPANIEISSRGKSDLLIKTPDQTLEPRNRRVEITIR